MHQESKDFGFTVTRYVHAALRGSNHASIWKHATANRSGGHLEKLNAIGQFYESSTNLQVLIIVTSEAVSTLEQTYNGHY